MRSRISVLFVALCGLMLFAMPVFSQTAEMMAPTTQPDAPAPQAAKVPTSAKDRKPHPATQPGKILELSLAELGNFNFDSDSKDATIPDDVKAITGVVVRVHGFMIPMEQGDHFKKFALIPSLEPENKPIPIQQTIVVTCPPGKNVDYCPDEIVIEGKLTAEIVKDDGFIVGIFAVDATSVKPVAKK